MGISSGRLYGGAITAARDGDPNGLSISPIGADAGTFCCVSQLEKGYIPVSNKAHWPGEQVVMDNPLEWSNASPRHSCPMVQQARLALRAI